MLLAKSLAQSAAQYVQEVLAPVSQPLPWRKAIGLPPYLQEAYAFYCMSVLDTPCLLMCAIAPQAETPAALRKHWSKLSDEFEGTVIYVVAATSSHNRQRLIQQRVPFVVPGKQLYLPMLGAVLGEYFKATHLPANITLSAPAQLLLLNYLLGRYPQPQSAANLASQFGYSKMSLSRAVKELSTLALATTLANGREKCLVFTLPASALWAKALPYLHSPVQKRTSLHLMTPIMDGLLIAGESALSSLTLLASPAVTVKSITASDWTRFRTKFETHLAQSALDNDTLSTDAGKQSTLELWRYDPRLLSDGDMVDPLSLYLSLREQSDERVEQALAQLLENIATNTLKVQQ